MLFIASIFACISSQPGDMILTETYKSKSGNGFTGVISDIYKTKGGVAGFFTGTGARIVHVSRILIFLSVRNWSRTPLRL